jgi:hypothetical protein
MKNIYDNLYDVLSNVHRRRLLFTLLVSTPQTQVLRNLDTPPDTALADDTKRIEYHHVHLPKLADNGFIEWSPDTDRIERGPRFDEIKPALELLAAHHEGVQDSEVLYK